MRIAPATLLASATVAIALGVGAVAQSEHPEHPTAKASATPAPEVIALKFYADWCGACKAMAPAYDEAKKRQADTPVLFVTLDLTDDFHSRQAAFLASALGVGDIYADNAGKTGFALLIDADSKAALGKLTADQSADTMHEQIAGALAKAPAADHPTGEHPTGEHPTGEHPTGEHPTGEHPIGEHPIGEHPTGEHPAGEHPTGEHPAGEHPTGEQPAAEKPAGGRPGA